jgi:ATP-dependent RNA helicase DHX37/DHR1
MKVFNSAKEGVRMIIVSTNVAETSLTIPDVRYVVDTGRVKQKTYSHRSGMSQFSVSWTSKVGLSSRLGCFFSASDLPSPQPHTLRFTASPSKASADQRSGRAGRTGPGHAYRIYSSAVFHNDFQQFDTPEIQRVPLDAMVLQMKAMGIENVSTFPYPSPPPPDSLRAAHDALVFLGALAPNGSGSGGGGGGNGKNEITVLGSKMALFPISPRYAKMLLFGHQKGCLPYVICMASAMCIQENLILDAQLEVQVCPDLHFRLSFRLRLTHLMPCYCSARKASRTRSKPEQGRACATTTVATTTKGKAAAAAAARWTSPLRMLRRLSGSRSCAASRSSALGRCRVSGATPRATC